ncbi:selenium cofactor biosynthesis protein YqeC [Tepidibacter sp. Z1-5]|uniref:selenium cofactor biosynthesis protein YqeC n=1 Tax=Tepidibacter sp. Z1-5 TaxID=3134138 RepID=UPI0030C19AD5
MKLIDFLEIENSKCNMISIVGGGGKTSTLLKLSKELKKLQKSVLITTTTKMYIPTEDDYDVHICSDKYYEYMENIDEKNRVLLSSSIANENKILGVSKQTLDDIYIKQIYDFIIIEADGAKRKPIKASNDTEPQIPIYTDFVIGVIGIDCFNKKITEDIVHRIDIFNEITNTSKYDIVDENVIVKLVKDKKGIFKNSENAKKILILNKCDTKQDFINTKKIIDKIKENMDDIKIVVSKLNEEKDYIIGSW